jgi:putative hydroxymethylpyrimidine transport system permease protein
VTPLFKKALCVLVVKSAPLGQSLLRFISVMAVLLLLWQSAIWLFAPRAFLLPSPFDVANVFLSQPAYLAENAFITLQEMVLGLIAGSLAGIVVALVLSQFPLLDRYVMPIVVTTQTLPVFAIAPILVIWFGFGIGSKIVMASLIIFFPVASSFYDGLKQTPQSWLDLGQSWGAERRQLLRFMRIPAALPSLMSGLKVAATIAPIGAIVGEWAGAAGGLGFVMLQANARTQTDIVFAALFVLALCAFALRSIVVHLADRTLWWSARSV